MQKLVLALLLLSSTHLLTADDDSGEVYACSFVAHSPAGILTGACTTQSLSDTGSISRWKMTLTFDQQSTASALALSKDPFYDLVRTQCLADGSFAAVLSLWGDLVITPYDSDYVAGNKACAPEAQTVPNVITISPVDGTSFTLEFLFDERRVDYNAVLGIPTAEWFRGYMTSFRLLSGNPPQ
jgi:hypothetical protein